MKKNILYISYHYLPSNSIGANRSFTQVSALRLLGNRVKLVHASNDNSRYITNSDHIPHEDDISIEIDRGTINTLYNKGSFIKSLIIRYFSFLLKFYQHLYMFFFGDQQDWDTPENFDRVVTDLNDFEPDLIISTCGPIENHSFASKFKELYSCFWVAEYRDSWSYNPMISGTDPSDFVSALCRLRERKIIHTVDLILAVSPIIKNYYEHFFNKKTYLIFSGWMDSEKTLPEPVFTFKHPVKKNILHLGSMLLGKRSPIPLINLFERNALLRENYNMHFIGRDTNLFKSHLENTSYAKSSIFLENEISFMQSRAEGTNADFLLLLMMDHPGEQHVVTGKIYEYIFLQKPIIIIDSQSSEASKIVSKYNLGYICKSIDDFEDLLISLCKDYDVLKPSIEVRNQFNVLHTIEKFMRHLDQFSSKQH